MVPLLLTVLLLGLQRAHGGHDYAQALKSSILFFEAQRSGYLPSNQRVSWRGNSGLKDGKSERVNLVGGYYDAGDNVKFGLPMAFTVTMMAWSVIEYRHQLSSSGELGNAMDAIKWGTDYLIKAHPQPTVLYGEVGDGNSDHYCWQRPEDMTTERNAYRIDPQSPGSDLAGETAAAMAAASVVFRRVNPAYSRQLLQHAQQLFEFADTYRGKYDVSIRAARKFYQSYSSYPDELLWAAAWLYKATDDRKYSNYLATNGDSLGGTGRSVKQFGWDDKYGGVQVLISQFLMQGKAGPHEGVFGKYQLRAEAFVCSCLGKGIQNVKRTPGGLMFHQRWNNLQFVTSSAFLLTVYSDSLAASRRNLRCPIGEAPPSELLSFAQSQVDYILGDNPRATSYMVGYGDNFPMQVHHRASSIVSYKKDRSFVACRQGYALWFSRKESNPNVLVGAIVGGPDASDFFADERENYEQTEPATYNNAPLIGVLARMNCGGGGGLRQTLPVKVPAPPKTHTPPPKPTTRVEIQQNLTASWIYEGRTYRRYSAVVTNNSPKTLTDLKIAMSEFYGSQWGLTKIEDLYGFPPWVGSLLPGKSMEFVYIHASRAAKVAVYSYKLS